MFFSLLQNEENNLSKRKYFARITDDEQTLRHITGIYDEKDNSWKQRGGYDNAYWKKLRQLNQRQKKDAAVDFFSKLGAI